MRAGGRILTPPTLLTGARLRRRRHRLEEVLDAFRNPSYRQLSVDAIEFTGSARKHYAEHGITDDDAMHAIRNPFRIIKQRGIYEGRLMIIGVDSSARFLEVVAVPADEPERIIHVNVLQLKRYDYL